MTNPPPVSIPDLPDLQSGFLIAAAHSGAGKTTVTLGILGALRNRGHQVQPFKCGPDYLDPKLHTIASGRESINLDRFMMDDTHIRQLYEKYGHDASVLVTEGVMGLFDGAVKMEGSSADLACLLQIPVIMVINAKAMAYSAAAILLGFKMLRPELKIAGVIFNFVQHESHYQILKSAAEDVGITALGYLPDTPDIKIPSRHLGLKTGTEIDHGAIIASAAAHIEKHILLDELIRITADRPATDSHVTDNAVKAESIRPLKKILVARDEAFNFIYPENLAALASLGELSFFSPLKDHHLPEADLIYLPGGYPELHLETLSSNKTLLNELQVYARDGGKLLAECGGMMYLGKSISNEQAKVFPMAGILDFATGMQHKKLAIGYKRVKIRGTELRGHEFHYSGFMGNPDATADVQVYSARQELLHTPVFSTDNILASYLHFYFGDNIQAIKTLLFG